MEPDLRAAAPPAALSLDAGTIIKVLFAVIALMFALLLATIVGGVWYIAHHQGGDSPTPSPATLTRQIREAMQHDPHAAQDARFLAEVMDAGADTVLFDEDLESPHLTTNKNVDDMWVAISEYGGYRLGGDYPALTKIIADYGRSKIPKSGKPNVPAVVAAYRELATAFRESTK